MTNPPRHKGLTRRRLLTGMGAGLGAIALGELLGREGHAATGATHFTPRAKRVIYLHMVGGFSHLDLVDPKPLLRELHGKPCPDALYEGKRFAFIKSRPEIMGPRQEFTKSGRSGVEISNLLPGLQSIVDKVTLIRSMKTDEINHGPAQLFLLTGFPRYGRPSLGAWMGYGLGSENEDLPAFVSLVTGNHPGAGNAVWGSGFLPSEHQGVELRSQGDPVLFLSNPPGIDTEARRRLVETIAGMNEVEYEEYPDPEILARTRQYEMAFRMQSSVPGLLDLSDEPASVLERYGVQPGQPSFARNCLFARRLAERDVRFVQLFDSGWDHHMRIDYLLPRKCAQVDQATAALVEDLDERGLLDDTLVVFSTEFGRTPMAQATNGLGEKAIPGRDHHAEAFSIWLAGGGVAAGKVHGETDEFGYEVVRDPVHVHDLNATILHLLGIDHERLTYRYQGRDFRLTDVHGRVVHDILS